MSKYAPLVEFLNRQSEGVVQITFQQIGELVGGLPKSALNHSGWWANYSHTWARLWTGSGWECVSADRIHGLAVFRRCSVPGQNNIPRRLPARDLRKITSEHIWSAVQSLLTGAVVEGFAPSTDYDLVVDEGVRLAPKQVFGLAATEALGFKVMPRHFTTSKGSVCFELLEEAGYRVVAKGQQLGSADNPFNSEGIEWAEGKTKLAYHLRRERAPGLSKAKKAAFLRMHGYLFCERCQLDPVAAYGEFGVACIEVHHNAVHVANMSEGHKTTLDQVECLCANCHRVEHRKLKQRP
ncbi:HNH endonuclease [Pseudomonas asplenii]|uniref:HNH endonuclease n=1 Tax=Pseudomonas asplenii TaxID=53407 RepID=UPI0022340204|nr:hypothetical protein [Pseudomonas asplenii]UZE31149.1 hypothetical protein LOY63_10650 [Pseudomonas asplenii]